MILNLVLYSNTSREYFFSLKNINTFVSNKINHLVRKIGRLDFNSKNTNGRLNMEIMYKVSKIYLHFYNIDNLGNILNNLFHLFINW